MTDPLHYTRQVKAFHCWKERDEEEQELARVIELVNRCSLSNLLCLRLEGTLA